jgi:hypothetical protein
VCCDCSQTNRSGYDQWVSNQLWIRYGVRAVCLRTTGMEQTPTIDVVFGLHAKGHGITQEEFRAARPRIVIHRR